MADRLWRAQVTIPLDSAIPNDAMVNTFYFDDDDDPLAGPEDTWGWIFGKLDSFYQSIDNVIMAGTVGTPAKVRLYDMADPEPRQVLATHDITLSTSLTPPLPSEVCMVASFAAADESGVPPARRRGRVYIGPIAAAAGEVVGSQLRPTLAARQALANAMEGLATPFLHPASPGYHLNLAVYSPTTRAATGSIGEAFNDVKRGWVDDAFDTQRRRGCAPTTRETWTV